MKHAFEKAGLDTASADLAVAAFAALKAANRSPAVAVDSFADRIIGSSGQLMALMGIKRADVVPVAMRYLQERAQEMAGKPVNGGASHRLHGSRREPDRPSPAPVADRPSPVGDASLNKIDRPARIAPATKIRKSAVQQFLMSGIFARTIGSGQLRVGDVTRFDVIRIKRRSLIDGSICDGLLEFEWPDDQTPLHKVASEDRVKAVFDRAYHSFDALGLSHASA